jgi:xanthine dehydrogenase YagR molybdenum-binding subunit
MSKLIGQPLDRVDGRLKVTGKARYAAEHALPGLAHAVIVQSTVPRGTVLRMSTSEAESAPGVLAVLTPRNAPAFPGAANFKPSPFLPRLIALQDSEVLYNGQPIALVVADTLERARHAASLVRTTYTDKPALVGGMKARLSSSEDQLTASEEAPGMFGPLPHSRGEVEKGFQQAAVRVEATYSTPTEHHNPMEPHATVAVWEDAEHLTVYDANQGVFMLRQFLSMLTGLKQENIRVLSRYIGGGFGCKALFWPHIPLSVLAAKVVGRPVKLVLTRQQMFSGVGFRPETLQKVELGADAKGKLTALRHTGYSETSESDSFVETFTGPSKMLYACANVSTSQRLVRLSTGTPTFMRAPGECTGTFALESAMDELAYALKLDPVELRRRNYAEVDGEHGTPWSSNSLLECYRVGAERFGWSRRKPEPRSMREEDTLIGYGMANALFPAFRQTASALVRVLADGTAVAQCGTQDLGTGAYTVFTQVAAETLGLPPERVRMEMGDTLLPPGPLSGGSATTATVSPAIQAAALEVRRKLVQLATGDKASPLFGVGEKEVVVEDGRLFHSRDKGRGETLAQLLERQKLPHVEAKADSAPSPEARKYSMYALGSHFVEVRVDELLGTVRLGRIVSVMGAGRILNAKTARSQIIGGVVFGLGMALTEETKRDPRSGRVMTADLADYHVPCHADIPEIEVHFLEEKDPHVNPLGVKGIGEIGTTGIAAAVANAVFHATGKRVRDLPITLDKLL